MILHGDCLDILKSMEADSIDALVTDPPAGISFMQANWDSDKGGRDQWIAWLSSVMKECMRVMKPGAHGLVWAIPRTSHWTATACEDAGFEIRDVITHLFGSGFPKSLDISKAIDKAAGVEREVIGKSDKGYSNVSGKARMENGYRPKDYYVECDGTFNITAPATPEAKQWQGFGTALKPASEHWVLIRKPLSEKTVAANVLKRGCGALNIDASRISTSGADLEELNRPNKRPGEGASGFMTSTDREFTPATGRFPANLLLSHNPDCVEVGVKKVKSDAHYTHKRNGKVTYSGKLGDGDDFGNPLADKDGTETVAAWECTEGCAVAELDRQSGVSKSTSNQRNNKPSKNLAMSGDNLGHISHGHNDSGGASRFFKCFDLEAPFIYCAKASKSDKGESNTHPTVKPIKLMSYLITMITPPNGTVLDPFAGSGSTGVAAIQSGFKFIGIEREKEYVEIANKRIYHAFPRFNKQMSFGEE